MFGFDKLITNGILQDKTAFVSAFVLENAYYKHDQNIETVVDDAFKAWNLIQQQASRASKAGVDVGTAD